MKKHSFGAIVAAFLLVLGAVVVVQGIAGALIGAALFCAWNLVAVPLFHQPEVAYWQCVIIGVALSLVLGAARTGSAPKNMGAE